MIGEFLRDLYEHGHVRVGPPQDDEWASFTQLLAVEDIRRRDFPATPPEFDAAVASWAATVFYRACQAATFRELAGPDLDRWLDIPRPPAEPASCHYSADLVFRFLPDLCKLAGQVSPHDPLVTKLRGWANTWPLASVGIQGVEPDSLTGIVDHAGMLGYYADRVIARRDATRLADPRVAAAVRRAIGPHAKRFPELASTAMS